MKDSDFLHGDITRQLINAARRIFDELGYGHPEKIYQRAFEKELNNHKKDYKRECYSRVLYDGETVGKYFLDFLVENKVAVELKVRREIYESDWIQLLNYLKARDLRVGLLIVFAKQGVVVKRLGN